ncbi:hypothetical protein SNEBB_005086 [Seison nebaliae]|nr:hypothetical protein SNEBB_005086 [Seison nebaliae]
MDRSIKQASKLLETQFTRILEWHQEKNDELVRIYHNDGDLANPNQIHQLENELKRINIEFEQMNRNFATDHLQRLQSQLMNVSNVAERGMFKMLLDQLKYDHRHYMTSMEVMKSKLKEARSEARRRNELLQTQFEPSNDIAIPLGDDLVHRDRLAGANTQLDNLIDHGQEVIHNLRNQHDVLKNVRRKMWDVGKVIGLSQSILSMIERRNSGDRIILFGGMIFVVVVVLFFYYYFT